MRKVISVVFLVLMAGAGQTQTYLQDLRDKTNKEIANVTPYTLVNGVYRGPFMDSTFFFNRIGTPFYNTTAAIMQRGVSADDYSTIAAAINAVEADTNILIISSTKTISTSDTMRTTCALQVNRGGRLSINAGRTLLIQNGPYAGPYQIFTGSGTVTIDSGACEAILPEWFGALPNDATDDATAINRAINAARKGTVIQFGTGTYLITSTSLALNERGIKFRGVGNGTVLKINSDDIHGLTVTAADVTIENMWIRGYAAKSVGAGVFLDDGSENVIISNVKISECGVAIEEDIEGDTENNLFTGNDLRSNQYDFILRYLSNTKVAGNLR